MSDFELGGRSVVPCDCGVLIRLSGTPIGNDGNVPLDRTVARVVKGYIVGSIKLYGENVVQA